MLNSKGPRTDPWDVIGNRFLIKGIVRPLYFFFIDFKNLYAQSFEFSKYCFIQSETFKSFISDRLWQNSITKLVRSKILL